MNRKLLRGEQLISTWQDITLTTHRVWQIARDGSSALLLSIPIDAVQWVRLGRHHLPALLWLAAGAGVLGFVALGHDRNLSYGLFVVALLLLLLYMTTRRLVLEIGAGTGKLLVQVVGEGASFESALEFVYQIESRYHAEITAGGERHPSASDGWPASIGP